MHWDCGIVIYAYGFCLGVTCLEVTCLVVICLGVTHAHMFYAQGQVADLVDVRDLTTAAVAGLEATLERIEKGAATASVSASSSLLATTRPGGARRVPVFGG